MPQHETHAARETLATTRAQGDPWQAFGYIVGGVGFYGVVGYGLDRWWGTSFMVVLGILAGAVLGTYMTVKYLGTTGEQQAPPTERDSPARREQD